VQAGREAAADTGLALDAGPTTTALAGAGVEVLDTLHRDLDDGGAGGQDGVEVKLEVPRDAREDV
jgi:hypothetical protein